VLPNFKWKKCNLEQGFEAKHNVNMQSNSAKDDSDEMEIIPSEHNGTVHDNKNEGMPGISE